MQHFLPVKIYAWISIVSQFLPYLRTPDTNFASCHFPKPDRNQKKYYCKVKWQQYDQSYCYLSCPKFKPKPKYFLCKHMEIPALDIMRDFVSWQQETIVTCFTTTASLQSLCCWQFYKACSQSKKSSIKNTLHGRTPCFQSKYSWSYLMAQHILIIHF